MKTLINFFSVSVLFLGMVSCTSMKHDKECCKAGEEKACCKDSKNCKDGSCDAKVKKP